MSTATPTSRVAGATAASALFGVGALHAAWGAGLGWPMDTRAELSDAVFGAKGLLRGGAGPRNVVAGTLGVSAAVVAGWPRRADPVRRVAVAGIAVTLAARGGLGLVGRTDLVSPRSTGSRFRQLDRRAFGPLCLTLAGLTALSLGRVREPDHGV